jgi:hypothetical protein
MKPAASECRLFGPKCIKTHLRASTGPKNFFRLAIARHEGEQQGGEGRGGEGKGRGGEGGAPEPDGVLTYKLEY